ncbi:hypothetical protein ACIREE_11505 [Streptomyces sp. NPDC102467]|uniref:hypothetical protein n=1 Tax=Streptomyces sp. NPDC102467 TaxID=3366179 RepID=UPI0037FECA4F
MTTPPMFYPQEDGKLVEIPEEHAKVLELYRDRMPLVFEVMEWGPPGMHPLIDVNEEPPGTPRSGGFEDVARSTARYLKAKRLGKNPAVPDFERLAVSAIRAHVEHAGTFAGSVSHDDGMKAVERAVKGETARAGRSLHKAVDKAVTDHTKNLVENWLVTS